MEEKEMSHTQMEEGFATSSRGSRKEAARAEASASVRVQRDRSILYRGICSNCEKLDACNYPSAINDTWYCEEYSVEHASQPFVPQMERTEQPETVSGLCMNCELRSTCKLQKPAGGVWYCNEYE
jgi:hypothetical protein